MRLVLGALFGLFVGILGKDATQTQYAIGSEVVVASIRKIQDTCIFPNDLLFMRRLAYLESKDGNDLRSFWNSDKGRNGIWQATSSMLTTVQLSTTTPTATSSLQTQLGINISAIDWAAGDMSVPLNDVAVARLFTYAQAPIPLGIQDQANYWASYYANSGNPDLFVHAANEMPKCTPPGMDLIFIVDASGSIGADVFQNVRDFLTTIISSLQTGQSNRVAIVVFTDTARIAQALTFDLQAAYQAAANLFYDNGGTNIESGINLAIDQFTSLGRPDVPLVAVLMTDGDSDGDPAGASNRLKALGVNYFTIGVGTAATTELENWSSEPHCMFYYSLNDFAELSQAFPDLLNAQICDVSAVIPNIQTCANAYVDQGQYIFYQIPVNTTTGATVKLEMSDGAATIYLSMTSRLPSSADYDFYANANVEFPGQIYISPQDLQSAGVTNAVYAAIVGQGPENNFTLCDDPYDTVENYTTPAPFVTNSSCISLELIFILDRSQSVYPDYYNNNVTAFITEIANQFVFHNEATPGNPAYARFGVIEFASEAKVTIPLGNYTRTEFSESVFKNVAYSDEEGESDIGKGLMAAYSQFKQKSIFRNRAVILVIDDIESINFQDAKDALNKLETLVTLPMGTVMSGTFGNTDEAFTNLQNFIGPKGAFPSMDTAATDGMLDLMDNTYPCTALPACSAIIFIEEATTAIGQSNKKMFLNLVSRLVNSIEYTPNQRFGLALYGKTLLKDVELQMFEDFNRTLNDYIRTVTDDNSPNAGQTYLQPIFQALDSTIAEQLYDSYSILLMGELEAVRDPGAVQQLAQSIADRKANVYILDQTRKGLSSGLWNTITGNSIGHVINGTNATPDLLFATFSQTIIPEFLARGC